MGVLEDAVKKVVTAKSQAERARALKLVSRKFYAICRQEGLERTDILSLAAEIVGCFNQDVHDLQKLNQAKQ